MNLKYTEGCVLYETYMIFSNYCATTQNTQSAG